MFTLQTLPHLRPNHEAPLPSRHHRPSDLYHDDSFPTTCSTLIPLKLRVLQHSAQISLIPFPVHHHHFVSQGQHLAMAYMDVQLSCAPNHRTVVLMRGRNFCGATWNATIHVLAAAGYRVIVPDRIGWCKSSKPHDYQFSLHQLSLNTYNLPGHLGIPAKQNITVIGHSMGGMTAIRFALMYPNLYRKTSLSKPHRP